MSSQQTLFTPNASCETCKGPETLLKARFRQSLEHLCISDGNDRSRLVMAGTVLLRTAYTSVRAHGSLLM